MQQGGPVETNEDRSIQIICCAQDAQRRLCELGWARRQLAIGPGRFEFDEEKKRLGRLLRDIDDLRKRRDRLAIDGRQRCAMPAAVRRGGIGAADIEGLQFGKRQVLDPRCRTREPATFPRAADLRFEAIVVKDYNLAVARQLHVELGAIGPARSGTGESRERVLRP